MLLANLLNPKAIAFEPRVLAREQVYREIIDRICHQRQTAAYKCGQPMLDAILERERESSMAYPSGIAIPHIRVEGLADTLIGMTFLQTPIDYDGTKVHWVALIFTDRSSSNLYLNIVAALLKLSQDQDAMAHLHSLADGHAVVNYLKQQDIKVGKDLCIADIMVSNPICAREDMTLKELDSLINEHRLSMLPVIDSGRRYLGEVNIMDVLKVGVPDYLMMMDDLAFLKSYEPLERLFEKEEKVLVGEIMQKNVRFLSPDASIVEAVSLMIQQRRRYVCVVDKGLLVGVVTAMDIFLRVIKA